MYAERNKGLAMIVTLQGRRVRLSNRVPR